MKTSEIQEMMKEDSKVDISSLDTESLRIPILHGKWYGILMGERKQLQSLQFDYDKIYHERYEYYAGRASDDTYHNSPINYKATKQEIEIHISADDKVQAMKGKIFIQKEKVDMIDAFLKNVINARSFHIKDAIAFIKFKNGQT